MSTTTDHLGAAVLSDVREAIASLTRAREGLDAMWIPAMSGPCGFCKRGHPSVAVIGQILKRQDQAGGTRPAFEAMGACDACFQELRHFIERRGKLT